IVNLAVSDGDLTDYDHSSVLINNVAPTVDAGLDQIVNVGETVQYNGFFNDLGFLDNHVFSWAFGGLCADKEKLNATVNLTNIKLGLVHEWKCNITTNGERIFDLHFYLIVSDMSDSFQNDKEGIPSGFPIPPQHEIKIHPNGHGMDVTFNEPLPDDYQFILYTKVKNIDNVGIQWTTTKSGGEETNTGNMGSPNSPIGPFEKIYDEPGFYNSVLTIFDDDGGSDTDTMAVQVVDNLSPFSPSINGRSSGKAGEEYEYTFVTTDPNGDQVYYYIEWGDETNSGWLGAYDGGEDIILSHTWEEQGAYEIRAKAKDIHDAESDWGTLRVTMPRNRLINNPLFTKFIDGFMNRFPLFARLLQPVFNRLLNL
ncbi:MAG: hypothetical protein JSW06_03710, partial [Thermoplasmatales archaeon]